VDETVSGEGLAPDKVIADRLKSGDEAPSQPW
jgi:hypothetical protein